MAQHELIFQPMSVEEAIHMRDNASFLSSVEHQTGTESPAVQRIMVGFIGIVLVAAAISIVAFEMAFLTRF